MLDFSQGGGSGRAAEIWGYQFWHEALIFMRSVRTLELMLFQAGSGRGPMGKFQTRVFSFMRRLRTFEGSELELFEKGALA